MVVENFKPGTMKKMGLDYDDLKVSAQWQVDSFDERIEIAKEFQSSVVS